MNEYIKLISDHEKRDNHEQLKGLISKATETIQSLLISAPPLVVDFTCHPDKRQLPQLQATSAKKNSESTSELCVSIQSTLFYSYLGETVAKQGEYAWIKKEFLARVLPGNFSQASSLGNHEVRTE